MQAVSFLGHQSNKSFLTCALCRSNKSRVRLVISLEKFSLGKRMSGDIRARIDYLSSGCIGCNIACCGGAFTGVQSAHCSMYTFYTARHTLLTLKHTAHYTLLRGSIHRLFSLHNAQFFTQQATHCSLYCTKHAAHFALHTFFLHNTWLNFFIVFIFCFSNVITHCPP